jgi:hypothetical protein
MMQCKKYQYKLTEEAEAAVKEEIIRLEAAKGENFANAREVRNLFEKIITNQAARVSELENVDEEMLTTLTIDDLRDLDDLEAPAEKKEDNDIEKKAEVADQKLLDALTGILESSGQNTEAGNKDAAGKSSKKGAEKSSKKDTGKVKGKAAAK